MKINANCGATSAAGSWNEPMPGSVNSAACWCVMSICSPPTVPSSTWLASGSRSGGIFETRSRHLLIKSARCQVDKTKTESQSEYRVPRKQGHKSSRNECQHSNKASCIEAKFTSRNRRHKKIGHQVRKITSKVGCDK